MSQTTPSVYLCYRPSVSAAMALTLFHALRANGGDVFMDSPSAAGDERLRLAQMRSRSHFLVLLTPGLIEAFRRPDDRMRREIEAAAAQRRGIVPLLTHGFSFSRGRVPEEIAFLRRYYALTLTPETVDKTAERLCSPEFMTPIFGKVEPLTAGQQAAAQTRIAALAAQPVPSADQLQAEVIFNRALTRARLDYAGRLADYDEVLRLDPLHVHARFNRALTRRRSGDDLGALPDYDEVIRLDPTYYRAFNNRAEIHFSLGGFRQALADFNQAITLCPNFTMSLAGKALTLHALGQIDEARELWAQLVAHDRRFLEAAWVGRTLRLPPAMSDETYHLTLRLSMLSDLSDAASAPDAAD